jgi:hypothetical protein
MKLLFKVLALFLLTGVFSNLQGQNEDSKVKESQVEPKVMVYYFHYTRRCATCNAVEDVARKTVVDNYGKNVDFESCNLDEETGISIGEELGVNAQTLLVVSGEDKIDLTNQAFLHARSHPEKLVELLTKEIDHFL